MRKKFLKASALIAGLIAMGGVVMGGCKSSGKSKVGAKDKIEQPGEGTESKNVAEGKGKGAKTGNSDSDLKTAAELKSMVESIKLPDLPGRDKLLKMYYTGGGQGELFAGG